MWERRKADALKTACWRQKPGSRVIPSPEGASHNSPKYNLGLGLENETGFQSTEGATHTARVQHSDVGLTDNPGISYRAFTERAFGTMLPLLGVVWYLSASGDAA